MQGKKLIEAKTSMIEAKANMSEHALGNANCLYYTSSSADPKLWNGINFAVLDLS